MLSALKARLKRLPRYQWLERSLRCATGHHQERELGLLAYLVNSERIAVDVGAHAGVYTHVLLGLAAEIVAIEANPRLAAGLRRLYGGRARIVCAAVSSTEGSAQLRIPKSAPAGSHGIATIEVENTLGGAEVEKIEVPRVTLDGLNLGPVGFIKIDVEGHELDVLLGARAILARDRPTILVEAEDRHRPGSLQSICDLLTPLGYHGLMLNGGRLSPISNFNAATDQCVHPNQLSLLNAGGYSGRYINNFVFVA